MLSKPLVRFIRVETVNIGLPDLMFDEILICSISQVKNFTKFCSLVFEILHSCGKYLKNPPV